MWSKQRLFILVALTILSVLLYYTSTEFTTFTQFRNPAAPFILDTPIQSPEYEAPEHLGDNKAPPPQPSSRPASISQASISPALTPSASTPSASASSTSIPPASASSTSTSTPPASSSSTSAAPAPTLSESAPPASATDRILKQEPNRPIEEGTDIEPEGSVVAFVSRPDIKALKWEVQAYNKQRIAPGYWFMTPIELIKYTKPEGSWIGPHIYDGNGDLIWSGAHLCNNSWVADFRKIDVEGQDRLSWHDQHTASAWILDNHYNVVQTVDTGELGQSNTHDFFTVEHGKHYLYLARNDTHWTEARSMEELGYEGRCNVSHSLIIESDVRTGKQLFTWSSEDHVPWTESTLEIETIHKQCKREWEYLHANSIDKFDNGDYLLSSRLTNTLYRISKDDGSVLWRLNGQELDNNESDFELVNLNFSRQHDAIVREQNDTYALISLLDNCVGTDEQNATSEWSRAIKIALHFDTVPMRAELVSSIDHPHRELAFRRGNYMFLPNGNEFVGWSERALHSEHTPEGEMVLEAQLMTEVLGTYRSFKFPWIGEPDYPPDVELSHSTVRGKKVLTVYASWNGATEVAEWVLYETDQHVDKQVELARARRSGFETTLKYEGTAAFVYVQALGRDGRPLPFGRSAMLDTKKR